MRIGIGLGVGGSAGGAGGASAPFAYSEALSYNRTSNGVSYDGTVTPTKDADFAVVVVTGRANGASVAYTGTCTMDGASVTRTGGNEDTATTDFNAFDIVFAARRSFVAGVPVSLACGLGNSARPGGVIVFFFQNSAPASAVSILAQARATSSSATIASGSSTPTTTSSVLVMIGSTFQGSGTPTLSSFTPSGYTDLGISQVGNTLGGRDTQVGAPPNTNALSPSWTFGATSTSRSAIAIQVAA